MGLWSDGKKKKPSGIRPMGSAGTSRRKEDKQETKHETQVRTWIIKGFVDNGRGGQKKMDQRFRGTAAEAHEQADELKGYGWTGVTVDRRF